MIGPLRRLATSAYERLLENSLGETPTHVAVIQDGNRRYAKSQGRDGKEGYHDGADTTESMLRWCRELDIEELTLYAFSTENFSRPQAQQETLFDLIEAKLKTFADAEEVHEDHVRIRAIGETRRLPERVRDAIAYAEEQTRGYDGLQLNVALAYGGRAELLGAARDVAEDVQAGTLDPESIDADTLDGRLTTQPTRDVDLIVRTGGDERTSNFLPWHANGNEAAVFFCTPYWPEFRRVDFLRAIRTYEAREQSWRTTRAQRARALLDSFRDSDLPEARRIFGRLRGSLPADEQTLDDASEPTAD